MGKKGDVTLKYLREPLKSEYERTVKKCTLISGLSHPMITMEDVLRGYFILADYFTDASAGDLVESMLVGLRSEELLASALMRQVVSFEGKRKYKDGIDICSTLFYGLAKNHAFLDGNKRIALLMLLYQLDLYGYVPSATEREFEKMVVNVAADKIDYRTLRKFKNAPSKADQYVQAIAYSLRRMIKKKDNSYHISMTAKEFCDALEKAGVSCALENGKLKFARKLKHIWPFPQKEITYAIAFGGWSRVIGPKTARDTLEVLDLYNQYSSYQDFLKGTEPLYQMIQQFEGPLRRLKDE